MLNHQFSAAKRFSICPEQQLIDSGRPVFDFFGHSALPNYQVRSPLKHRLLHIKRGIAKNGQKNTTLVF
jgi:hypothetical protein